MNRFVKPEVSAPAGSSTQTDGNYNYLDVRYSEGARPYTEYPALLTEYLTTQFLAGYRGSKLLDLGSGRGEFLHGFARQGFDATGIDRSRPSVPRFSEPVIEADYERAGLPFGDREFSVLLPPSAVSQRSNGRASARLDCPVASFL
jgi:SAM-dependent methyltransferase